MKHKSKRRAVVILIVGLIVAGLTYTWFFVAPIHVASDRCTAYFAAAMVPGATIPDDVILDIDMSILHDSIHGVGPLEDLDEKYDWVAYHPGRHALLFLRREVDGHI